MCNRESHLKVLKMIFSLITTSSAKQKICCVTENVVTKEERIFENLQ